MFDSKKYWEERYKNGGTSGAGSRNRLAVFKVRTINEFIKKNGVKSVIDLGSGDGFIASGINVGVYTGFDVSESAVEHCNKLFESDMTKIFTSKWVDIKAELVLSLDIIFHLVEDDIYLEYLERLFRSAEKFVIIYSSNCVSTGMSDHYKDREFLYDVDEMFKEWELQAIIENPYKFKNDPEQESNSDFYIFRRANNENRTQ
jgi:SAM-dependent methyltransferase